jgi:hypothetical protein
MADSVSSGREANAPLVKEQRAHNISPTQASCGDQRMESVEIARPKLVWFISVIVGLMAASQLVILSFALSSSNPGVRDIIASVSALDWLTLYVLATILLTSMVFLFRLRSRAVSWFAVYIGLSSWAAWGYAVASGNPPYFDELVSLGGLIVALGVFGYMLRLRKRKVLT